jgi:hypothetical protein
MGRPPRKFTEEELQDARDVLARRQLLSEQIAALPTQAAMAKKLGISLTALKRILRGVTYKRRSFCP